MNGYWISAHCKVQVTKGGVFVEGLKGSVACRCRLVVKGQIMAVVLESVVWRRVICGLRDALSSQVSSMGQVLFGGGEGKCVMIVYCFVKKIWPKRHDWTASAHSNLSQQPTSSWFRC